MAKTFCSPECLVRVLYTKPFWLHREECSGEPIQPISYFGLSGPDGVMGWVRLLEEYVAVATQKGEDVFSTTPELPGFSVMPALSPSFQILPRGLA